MKQVESKNKVSFISLLAIIAFFTSLFSVVTIFNEQHRLLELFCHFRLQYLCLALFCGLILLFVYQKFHYAIFMFLITALNAYYIFPWYLNNELPENVNSIAELKILHSNVKSSNTKHQRLIDLIHEENPDIILVQELNDTWGKSLSVLKTDYPYHKLVIRSDNFGIAVFSKFSFDDIIEKNYAEVDIPSLKLIFTLVNRRITLITSHAPPPVNGLLYQWRNRMFHHLAEDIGNIDGPVILVGDLNVTMWSEDYKQLEGLSGLFNARQGRGILPSWPVKLPMLRIPIDHLLLSADFYVEDIKLGKNIASDHLPLIARIRLMDSIPLH